MDFLLFFFFFETILTRDPSCYADNNQLKHLRDILIQFEAISGLIYHAHKVPSIINLANILGGEGRVGELPTIYLSMPFGDKSKSKGIWNNVLEKYEKKLVKWKASICPWVVRDTYQ